MFKKNRNKAKETEEKNIQKEKDIKLKKLERSLERISKMAKDNDITDAVYSVWDGRSSIIVTEHFLYYDGSTRSGNGTRFHYGEAIPLNKVLSIEADYDKEYASITLGLMDGSSRFIKTFGNTKALANFFKEKARGVS